MCKMDGCEKESLQEGNSYCEHLQLFCFEHLHEQEKNDCLICGLTFCKICTCYIANEDTVCEYCFRNRCRECDSCNEVFVRRDTHFYNVENSGEILLCDICVESISYCEDCDIYFYNDHNCPNAIISPYHSQDVQPKFFGQKNGIHLGIELEIFSENRFEDAEFVRNKFDDIIMKIEEDTSIGNCGQGFEIVLHPCTLEILRNRFTPILEKLYDRDCRSNIEKHCGTHISIDLEKVSTLHLFKIMTLVYNNENFFASIAERKSDYAKYRCDTDAHNVKRYKRDGTYDRYIALNVDSCYNRLEFRLFRGTLKENTFLRFCECTLAVFEFTKMQGIHDMQPTKFSEFVKANRKAFANLYNFLEKKENVHPNLSE